MTDDNFSVKEMLSGVMLPKLDAIEKKLDTKAEAIALVAVTARMTAMELHGSQHAVAAMQVALKLQDKVDDLISWRNRMIGVVAVLFVIEPLVGLLLRAKGY